MNSKTLHIIGNEFTRNIGHPDEWWEHRLKIYEHYCLESIKNQTNKNFVLTMTTDFVPDKYRDVIKKILERSGITYYIRNVKDISFSDFIKQFSDGYDYIYHTRIDSDDLIHKDAVKEIQSYDFAERRALVFQKGYCLDCKGGRLQHYYMPSPPFSTIMYPIDVYLDEKKQDEYKQFRSHDELVYKMNTIVLSENKFIVNVHGTNRITIYHDDRTIFTGHEKETEITENVDKILTNFGININTYNEKIRQN